MDRLGEQQRLVITVAVSLAIFIGWELLFPKPAPVQPVNTPQSVSALKDSPKGVDRDDNVDGSETSDPAETRKLSSDSSDTDRATSRSSALEGIKSAVKSRSRTFTTGKLRGVLSNLSGAYTSLELADYSETSADDGESRPVSLVSDEGPSEKNQGALTLEIEDSSSPILDFVDDSGLHLGGATEELTVGVKIDPIDDSYALRYQFELTNESQRSVNGRLIINMGLHQVGSDRSMFAPTADVVSGLCFYDGGVDRELVSSLEDDAIDTSNGVKWAGIDRQYFVVAAVAQSGSDGLRCTMRGQDRTALATLEYPIENLKGGERWTQEFTLFVGPKRNDVLEAVDPLLEEVIEYDLWGIPLGAIARPMVFLLNLFHGWMGNWGLAIIGLTLVVKLALFPVTYRSAMSMKKMQALRPQIEKIKKQYENDRERQQVEQAKLFREHGVGLGGCLPLFLQMPIWAALYRSLWTSVDLYQQPFLWIDDLTAAEPIPFLAVAVGGFTFLQQRLQPSAVDNQQMKVMMIMMPIMFTFFMFALPSGLVLYILINNILTIIQQLVINRQR